VLGELGAELPPSTRALLAVSNFAQRFGPLLALAAVGMAAIATRWAFTPHVRARIDGLLLGLPIVGGLRLGFASARACRALGGMLTSGMPLLPALDAAATATGDLEVSRRLANSRAAVARGARLTQALEAQRALSPLALQLVGVGEATGRLGPMLSRAGELVAEDADRSLRTAVALLEPALVVTLGLLVAGVAAALLQAVYSVRPG
jgi:type II secretory pathway component PulF